MPHLDGGRGLCFPASPSLRATGLHHLDGLPDHAALELPQEVPDLEKRGGGRMGLLGAQGWRERPKPTACCVRDRHCSPASRYPGVTGLGDSAPGFGARPQV